MKLVFSIFIGLIFISCASHPKHIPADTNVFVMDFTKYSKQGFLFTPHKYQGKYKAIGLLEFSFSTEGNWTRLKYKDTSRLKPTIYRWHYETINLEVLLDIIHKKSVQMGADALIDMRYEFYREQIFEGIYRANVPGFKMSGFAIKRLD